MFEKKNSHFSVGVGAGMVFGAGYGAQIANKHME